ncbi:histone-lysine N-methyltransferase ASHR2 [Juglans microcarpa x Juglans regia]|uniref:histone-lysine N-methyltransferase ASHR2 n=1 Tax=Juglans microcarpa x Juglans regia TaxID=2249226 RepID=UPI001B7DC1C5|nr:histone-lysine N-methyltransferase ASHR2 [Juglans microcarpa x Juglans regia]XP_041012609.1 histone-lysine N-methyltransferase ASHR2 [Juglans microcarpa x Juglans regia]XP_041012610.1 histone-lysine N-methyltransferase ASHR2 [Juglans microcarpa x Juglans regia]XP_041012611.1 histone-lysine N-methyltransferase ASHR2 [Juglans microcarpa x Juglans regia]
MSTSAAAETGFLRIEEIEGRGRGLVASQPLKAGQIVLRDSPILLYSAFPLINPSSSSRPSTSNTYCARCFRTLSSSSPSVVSCPSCSHFHVFCSQNCLSAALTSSHTPWVCQALSRLRDCSSLLLEQPMELQLQALFLVAAYNLSLVSLSQFQILLSLEGTPGATDSAAAHFLHSLISSLLPSPPLEGFSVELTAALLAKDKLNAFGLMEPFSSNDGGQRSVRAYGIYPNASFFNHDCLPNACRFDYVDTSPKHHNNTDIIVRMIHDVPQGREICLSYFPVNENYASRQRRLMEDYGFTCHCDRCKVEVNWSDDDNDDLAEEEEEIDEVMDEDHHDQVMESSLGKGDADFPHAYFFVRYMCDRENCWGTLAPLPPKDEATPSDVMECNVCGNLNNDQVTDANGGEDQLSMDD